MATSDNPMVKSVCFLAFGVCLSMLGNFHVPDVGQRAPGRATEPAVGVKTQIFSDKDPNDAAAWLVHQLEARFDTGCLAVDHRSFQLNVPDDFLVTHHQVIAAGIEFGTQHFYIGHAALPQPSLGIAHEHVLDNPLTQCRVEVVRILLVRFDVHLFPSRTYLSDSVLVELNALLPRGEHLCSLLTSHKS